MHRPYLVILAEAPHALQHHGGCLIADGAVGRVHDGRGGLLDQVNGALVGGLVQHVLDQRLQLGKPDAAGHALAAGLGMAQPQKVQRHVHRAQPGLAGADAPAHIQVQAAQYGLGLAGGLNS